MDPAAPDTVAHPQVIPAYPAYPAYWEADVLLRDGSGAHVRPMTPADAPALVAFYDRVSQTSKYFRFFSANPHLSAQEITRFVDVDHDDAVSLALVVGETLVGVGQFVRLAPGSAEAEVAFLVQDDFQKRGIGQLLLEHLAQIAREVGVGEFQAEVLSDNDGMLQVFRDAGYQVARVQEHGVLHLRFGIDVTDTATAVMQAREHRAETASVQRFFGARSVAIVGASRRLDTVGRQLVRNLVLGDYRGRVYVVNPAAEAVAGMPAYDRVTDIPDEVDIAVVAVPAEAVPEVILDCAAKNVHGLVVVSSGFAETGDDGRRAQRQVVRMCRQYGLRLIGPNALGIINTASDVALNASLSPTLPPRGRAGFFCQSGALGVAILENVARRGLGLSSFVSAGNRADVSGNDLLQYWEDDEATEVVLLYLESIGNPRKFSRIARRVSRRKPVIAVKSGRTTQGVPMGHSVRSSEVGQVAVDAMFAQAGVIQVDTLDEMFDVAQLLAHQPLPAGNRVAIVGNSDALALMAADSAAAVGLEASLQRTLSPDAQGEDFEAALDAAIDDPQVDAVLAVFIPPVNTAGADVATVLAVVGEQSDKPVLSTFLAVEGVPELLRVPDVAGSSAGRGSVPSYPSPEAAVRALARAKEYADWLARPEMPSESVGGIDVAAARRLITRVLAGSPTGRDLDDAELGELLDAYGVPLWERVAVGTEEEALAAGERLGWDVVLKATGEHLRHRPDLAHIRRQIADADDMREAWATLRSAVTDTPAVAGFVVQRNASPGVPVALVGVEDALFGPVVSFGVSGFSSELLGDRAFRIPPMGARDAHEMVREIRAAPLLAGWRGSAPVDLAGVEDLLLRIARLKDDLPQVRRLELPLVLAGVHGVTLLTARARVEPSADARTDTYVRRLSQIWDTAAG